MLRPPSFDPSGALVVLAGLHAATTVGATALPQGRRVPSKGAGIMADITDFPPDVRKAWAASVLADLTRPVASTLLEGARVSSVPGNTVVYSGIHHAQMASVWLVVDGLFRVLRRAEDGRQVTIRYAGPSVVLGIPSLVVGGAPPHDSERDWQSLGGGPVEGEALQPSRVLALQPDTFLRLARTAIEVAWPVLRHLAEHTVECQQILSDNVFMPLRARVGGYLLEAAVMEGDLPVVRRTHAEIANALGTVREVVSRVVGALERENLVVRREGRMVLLDPAQLHDIATTGRRKPSSRRKAGAGRASYMPPSDR
jgi:CRP-like cAMP-binding protein